MSLDSVSRIVTFAIDNIFTPNSYEYFDRTMNESFIDEEYQGSGPVIEIDVVESDDDVSAISPTENDYKETGTVIFNVFDEKGSGTRLPYTIKDVIRDAFRASPSLGGYKRLLDNDNGCIMFTNILMNPAIELGRNRSDIEWMKHTIIISYVKYYEVTA